MFKKINNLKKTTNKIRENSINKNLNKKKYNEINEIKIGNIEPYKDKNFNHYFKEADINTRYI